MKEKIPFITRISKMGPHHIIYIPKIRKDDFPKNCKVRIGVIDGQKRK